MDGSTYILTAVRGNNSVGIIDIGNPKMPRQVALLEDDDDLALSLPTILRLGLSVLVVVDSTVGSVGFVIFSIVILLVST